MYFQKTIFPITDRKPSSEEQINETGQEVTIGMFNSNENAVRSC